MGQRIRSVTLNVREQTEDGLPYTKIFREWLPENPDFELPGPADADRYDCIHGEKTDPGHNRTILCRNGIVSSRCRGHPLFFMRGKPAVQGVI